MAANPTSLDGLPDGSGATASPAPGPVRAAKVDALFRQLAMLDNVWLVAVLALAFIAATPFPVDQTDYWWTVKLGDELWASGRLPSGDPLAFTSTRLPYVEQQWLAQLVLAGVYRLGGLGATLLLRSALVALAMGLVFAACRRSGASAAAAALATALALLVALPGAATRPQLLAIPLFALFLLGTSDPLPRWSLAILPAAMVVWVNVHGSFPLGIVLVGIALAGRAWTLLGGLDGLRRLRTLPRRLLGDGSVRRMAILLGLCCLAVLANPYGIGLVPWLADFLTLHSGGQDAAVVATEWARTSLAERAGAYYFGSLALLIVALVRAGPPDPATCLRLLIFGLLALAAVRNTLWWGLVQAPALAWAIVAGPREQVGALVEPAPSARRPGAALPASRRQAAANLLLMAAFLGAAVLSLPPLRAALLGSAPAIADPSQPHGPADYLDAVARPGRLFNYLDWGGYLAYRLAPSAQVFVDGRFGIYPPTVYRDYFTISAAQAGWEQRLASYRVDTLVLDRRAQAPLVRALAGSAAWQPVYCDATAVVYWPASGAAAADCPAE